MIRIAYIVSTLKRCGPNSQLRNMIRYLDRNQFNPLVITLSPEPADSVKPLFEQDGIEVRSLNLSRMAGLFLARGTLRELLREQQVNVLHSQGVRADCLSAALRDEWPGVCSVRNFPQLDYPMTYGGVRGFWMARSHTRALAQVAAPVGVSAAVSRNLKDAFDVQAHTICNGVDTEQWTAAQPEAISSLRKQFGFINDETVWVSVGHLSERKDPLAVIRAFKAAGVPNTKLVFLGSGPLDAECRAAAGGDERIVFAGRVDNVADWLRAADGFVSASQAEGFPNAVLEALACGLPCVLSDIPPHGELAERAMASVQLYREGNDAALTQCFKQFVSDPTRRSAARSAAENQFSARGMSETYQEIYRELIHHA